MVRGRGYVTGRGKAKSNIIGLPIVYSNTTYVDEDRHEGKRRISG